MEMKREHVFEIVNLEDCRKLVNEDAVSTLEEYLRQAKEGKLSMVGVAAVLANGDISTACSSGKLQHHMVSAVANLAFRLQVESQGE